MATYRQLLKKAFRTEQHFLVAARQAAKAAGLVTAGSIINKNVISKLERKAAGTVTGTFSGLPQKLQTELNDVSYWFTKKVFDESQRLVPIDKRYIGRYNPNSYGRIKKSFTYSILKESAKNKYIDNKGGTDAESIYNELSYDKDNMVDFTVESGYYRNYDYEFLQKYFKGSNKRKYKQLVVDEYGYFKEYSKRYKSHNKSLSKNYNSLKPENGIENMKPMNYRWSDPQTGANGNQELKKSGRIDETKNGWTISYDPTREFARFNYASLQHDMPESVYKHKHGQSLYLLTAYEKYVKEFREAVKAKAIDVFKERLWKNG